MSKEAFYFSHDANARRDPKIVQMMSVYGYEGYGWYWAIVEMMREQEEWKLDWTGKYFIQGLAKELSTDAERALSFVDDCVEEFKLFLKDDTYMWSESLLKRMLKYQKAIEQRRNAGKMSARKRKDNKDKSTLVERTLKPTSTSAQQLKEIKLKETKEKKGKKTYIEHFPETFKSAVKFVETWTNWLTFRSELKKPLTETAAKQQVVMLSKLNVEHAIETIEKSIQNSWQGLFPPKETTDGPLVRDTFAERD